MRIFLDLDTRLILSTPNRSIRTLEFKRRDNDLLELQFVRGGAVVAVSSGTTVQYGLKPVDQYGAGFFSVGSFVKTGSGEAALFTASVNLNTVPIAQAFDLEPKFIAAMLEIEARDGDTVNSSITLPVTLNNDVIRGDEATPAAIPDGKATQTEAQAGTDNTKWMTPLCTFQSISAWIAANLSWASLTGKPSTFAPAAHKSNHATGGSDALTPADIGAARVTTGGEDPDPAQGVVDQAIQLWDSVNNAPALKISDGNVSFGPHAENTNVAANFREAIGAASATDPTLTGTLTVNGPEDENNAIFVAVSGEDWIKIGPSDATVSSTADLYMGSSGKIGIGTEDPTERLTIAGNLDMLGGAVKNLRAPVSDNDAVRKADLDLRVPTPPDSGTFSLQCVDGVISWVAA